MRSRLRPRCLRRSKNYFGVPYPYEKLDQITIPVTVAFGAMENAGLITYQSAILAMRPQDDTVAPAAEHDRGDHARDRAPVVRQHGDARPGGMTSG